jgi:hypothetical protein
MPEHDFTTLYAQYPSTIVQMPDTFTSHQFILELACQHQDLYVEALYDYRHHLRGGRPVPFLIVHRILAQHLNDCSDLVEQIRKNAPSKDIFGQDDPCSEWKRLR